MRLAGIKRVLVISSVDVRDINLPPPSYYTAADLEATKWVYGPPTALRCARWPTR